MVMNHLKLNEKVFRGGNVSGKWMVHMWKKASVSFVRFVPVYNNYVV
jgi:hypothetical protein